MKLLLSNKNIAFGIMGFIIPTLLLGCATVPITGRRQLSLVSQYQMLSLGQASYEQVHHQEKISRDKEKIEMVNSVGVRIAASAESFMRENGTERQLREYDWQFILIDDAPENRIENIKRQIPYALRYYKPQPIGLAQ